MVRALQLLPRRSLEGALHVMWAIGSGHHHMEIKRLMCKWIKFIMATQIHPVTCPPCFAIPNVSLPGPGLEAHNFKVNSLPDRILTCTPTIVSALRSVLGTIILSTKVKPINHRPFNPFPTLDL